MASYKRCVTILADGSRPDVFDRLIQEGRLPNIEKYLIKPGCLKHAVTTFPSTTGPAYLPYLTGCYPGTCNVPGIRWFDRDVYASKPLSRAQHRSYVGADTLKMSSDIHTEIKTLFELIPKSINVFNGVNRGVSFRRNKTSFMRLWNWYYAHLTDRWALVDQNASDHLLRHIDEDPEYMFIVFPGIDEYSHMGHPEHPAAIEGYERIDRTIGDLCQKLEQKKWLHDTAILIVSDHGLSATHNHLGVNQLLEDNGTKTLFYPVVFKKGFSAVHMVSGNGMSHLYFARGANGAAVPRNNWKGICYAEDMNKQQLAMLELLEAQDAVDLMALRSREGGVWVRRGRERARIYEDGDKLVYKKVAGDPLAYGDIPERLSVEESLQATRDTDYPDSLMQLLQLIRSPRAGDVMLSAKSGHDLRVRYEVPEHHGSHGSLHWEHMNIPIISNVPLRGETCRSVDVFPTILTWLGREIPKNIDGISRA